MRIIAGDWRGRRLVAPKGQATRPTADRARETLFSMLTSRLGGVSGLVVADLFAGSGALGLEALSRGAARCTFVERDRAALAALETNVATLGAGANADVRAGDALRTTARAPADLIFADPPYGTHDPALLLATLVTSGWTHGGTWLAYESSLGENIAAPGWTVNATRDVGKARLTLLIAD
jgi:16S rRNA (guanine966-N2)-methyltransferase